MECKNCESLATGDSQYCSLHEEMLGIKTPDTDRASEDELRTLDEILTDWEFEVFGTPKHWEKTTDRLEADSRRNQVIFDWHNKQIKELLDRLETQIKDTLTPDEKHLYILGDRYNIFSKIEREYDRPGDDIDLVDWENIELKELLGMLLSEHIDDIKVERKKLVGRPMKHSKECNGYHTTCTTCEQMNICISEFGAAEQCDGCIKLDDIITK